MIEVICADCDTRLGEISESAERGPAAAWLMQIVAEHARRCPIEQGDRPKANGE